MSGKCSIIDGILYRDGQPVLNNQSEQIKATDRANSFPTGFFGEGETRLFAALWNCDKWDIETVVREVQKNRPFSAFKSDFPSKRNFGAHSYQLLRRAIIDDNLPDKAPELKDDPIERHAGNHRLQLVLKRRNIKTFGELCERWNDDFMAAIKKESGVSEQIISTLELKVFRFYDVIGESQYKKFIYDRELALPPRALAVLRSENIITLGELNDFWGDKLVKTLTERGVSFADQLKLEHVVECFRNGATNYSSLAAANAR
jgi:hypothetical protein